MKTNPIFLAFTDTEVVSAREYLDVLESIEKIKPAETRFVPPTIGEPGFGHFQVRWRYPKYASVPVK